MLLACGSGRSVTVGAEDDDVVVLRGCSVAASESSHGNKHTVGAA